MNIHHFFKVTLLVIVGSTMLHQSFAQEAARVNHSIITVEAMNKHYQELVRQGVPHPTKKQALEQLIRREAALEEAKRLKIEQKPIIQERIKNVLYQGVLEAGTEKEISKIAPKESDLKAWYEKNPEIRTSQIFIALAPNATKEETVEAENKINTALKEITSGKLSFAEAAQRYSEDSSGIMGGDLDYRDPAQLDPVYYQAAIKISKIGGITGPIKSNLGLHLIRLTGKRSWVEVDRAKIGALYYEQQKQTLMTRYLDQLQRNAKISINNAVVKD